MALGHLAPAGVHRGADVVRPPRILDGLLRPAGHWVVPVACRWEGHSRGVG